MIDDQIIKDVDQYVADSNGKYRNRSHFVELTLREKVQKENAE